jgi:methionyl-tRNA formyltransferase
LALVDGATEQNSIERNIRGYIEWPRSHTTIGTQPVIITKAHTEPLQGHPGSHLVDGKKLVIFAHKGALVIDALKPEGKKEMPVEAFLAGYKHKL